MQQITQLRNDPDQIDLGIGQPGFDLLPLDFIQEAAQHFTNQVQREHLQYGAEAGDPNFLQELAYFLTDQYQLPIPSGQLMVTNGISQGLDLVCTLLTRPGDVIFVEEPTYFLALHLFADHGLQVVGIPMDEEGLLPDALAAALQQHQPVFLYTIPAFHNPTGRTLSAERRRLILEMSVTFDFLIVADEVYQMLDYGEMPPAPFAALVDSEQECVGVKWLSDEVISTLLDRLNRH